MRLIAVVCIVSALAVSPARASIASDSPSDFSDHCRMRGNDIGLDFACSRTLIARAKPRRALLLNDDWRYYAALWQLGDETFAADATGCRMYGRLGPVKVREAVCDGRLTVTYRSVAGPQPISIEWGWWYR